MNYPFDNGISSFLEGSRLPIAQSGTLIDYAKNGDIKTRVMGNDIYGGVFIHSESSADVSSAIALFDANRGDAVFELDWWDGYRYIVEVYEWEIMLDSHGYQDVRVSVEGYRVET